MVQLINPDGRGSLAGSSKLLRAMNSTAALDLLLERGRLTRGDLRAATGLSKPTVSDALRRLVDAELAHVVDHIRGGPGPNAEVYAINPDIAFAVAVSIGPEPAVGATVPAGISAALCDMAGTVRARTHTAADLQLHDPADVLVDAVTALVRGAGVALGQVGHVQLGVAGAYDRATQTVHHIDLPGFDQPGLVATIGARLGTDIDVDNDVNLAALAERRHGGAREADGFALLWLGDGLGLAIDIGGTLLRGARGGAGEIGYLRLGATDLQAMIGGPAVVELATEHGHTGATLAETIAAGQRDPTFIAALANRVAMAVDVVVAVLDPSLIVLGGPVAAAGGAPLADALTAVMSASALPDTPISISAVEGDPVVRGALDAAVAAVHAQLRARIA